MKWIVVVCFLLLLGHGIIVQSSEKQQFSHMRLDIGHSLTCCRSLFEPNHRVGYNGNVTILHAEDIKNGPERDLGGKAILLERVDLDKANRTVESVLLDVEMCGIPHLIVAETQCQRSHSISSGAQR